MAIDRITTGAVLDGAIQTADIATGAVDNDRLATNAVTAEKMAPGAAFVTGMVMPYAGAIVNQAAAPSGWLLCDGSEQDASVYASLKNLLLTTYGAYTNGSGGTGTTHFRLPDLRGRVIAALDNMGGGSANIITATQGDNLGQVLGTEEHTLTAAQSGMPSHGHADDIATSNNLGVDISGVTASSTSSSIAKTTTGSGGSLAFFNAIATGSGIGNQAGVITTSTSTSIGGSASITGSVSITGGVTDANGTNASQAHPLTQPTMFMNYIIKT